MRIRHKNSVQVPWLAVAVVVLAAMGLTRAALPHIDIIESYTNNQVLIHFNMEANHTHTVQRCTSLIQTSNGTTAVWSNIVTVDPLPYNDHWVAVDTNRTLPVRFYRLVVTPK